MPLRIVVLVNSTICENGLYTQKRNHQKKQLSQLDETSKDFVIDNSANVNDSEIEKLEQQTNGEPNGFEKVDKSAHQNQVIENNFDNQITKAVSSVVMTVEKVKHDAILIVIDNVILPRVEIAVKLFTASTAHGTNSEVQNPDRGDLLGIL